MASDQSELIRQLQRVFEAEREADRRRYEAEREEDRRRHEADIRRAEARQEEIERRHEAEREEDRRRHEADIRRAEAEREEDRRHHEAEREEDRRLLRPTTFDEFLQLCYEHITKRMRVEERAEYRSQGKTTNPTNRICPTFLKEWDFAPEHERLFGIVHSLFHPPDSSPRNVFPNRNAVEDRGKTFSSQPLANEAQLAVYQIGEVENPVKEIFSELQMIPEASAVLERPLGNVYFTTHAKQTTADPSIISQPDRPRDTLPPRSDQNCVFVDSDGTPRILYIIEYKAAHKLTDVYIQVGLRDMDMISEVVQRPTIPTDNGPEKQQYYADRLVCAAATQAYEYMMKEGLEYGVLTNGSTKVLLRIREADPHTLYYFPVEAAAAESESSFHHLCSGIACYISLTLLSLNVGSRRCQRWRNEKITTANRWIFDFDKLFREMSDDKQRSLPPSPPYRPPHFNRNSPFLKKFRRTRKSCRENPDLADMPSDPPDSPDSGGSSAGSRGSPTQSKRQRTETTGEDVSRAPQKQPNEQYCSHKCLMGLARQTLLDDKCPNIQSHRMHSQDGRHPIDTVDLVRLMERQLNQNPDHGCLYLGEQGLHGAIFRLTVDAFGYTVIGKGTIYTSDYESQMYRQLQPVQGSAVPIFLGDVYLRDMVYYLHADYVIVRMMLLGWAGVPLEQAPFNDERALLRQWSRSRAEVKACGVVQLDFDNDNALWNEELQRVLFIDFGYAKVLPAGPPRRPKRTVASANGNGGPCEVRDRGMRKRSRLSQMELAENEEVV